MGEVAVDVGDSFGRCVLRCRGQERSPTSKPLLQPLLHACRMHIRDHDSFAHQPRLNPSTIIMTIIMTDTPTAASPAELYVHYSSDPRAAAALHCCMDSRARLHNPSVSSGPAGDR